MVNFRYLPAGGNGIMLTSQTLTLLLWPHTCVKFLLQFHSLKPMIFSALKKRPLFTMRRIQLQQGSWRATYMRLSPQSLPKEENC